MSASTLFRKPSTCKCGGGYRRNKHQWRLIERMPYPRLKCFGCRWRWVSRRLYVDKLPVHKENHQGGLTDGDILARVLDGTLQVNPRTARVTSYTFVGMAILAVTARTSNGSTYRFVTIRRNGLKKKIALHRLNWIAYHKRLPPPGHDVDHIYGASHGRYPDRIGNLRLLDININRGRKIVDDIQDEEF